MMPVNLLGRFNSRSVLVLAILASLLVLISTLSTLRNNEYGQRAAEIVHQAVDAVEEATNPHTVTTAPEAKASEQAYSYDDSDTFCRTFPDPGNIAVILKTGATEVHDKVPTQLATSLKCVRNPIILSDLEQRLGHMKVHDVLSNVSPDAMRVNSDFDIYRLQQEYLATGRENELPKLRDLPNNSTDWRTSGKSAAWALDKYKFLHMIERSWELAPGQEWYLFVEADTYLSWPNMLKWLRTLDHQQKLYFGNAIRMWEYTATELLFGHGGSGILLSGAAVREFAATDRGIARKWDRRVHKMWFGDFVLAAALYEELKIRVRKGQPSMTGNEPEAQAFVPEMWCRPVLTVHHINMQHTNTIWQHERKKKDDLMLWKDVYGVSFPQGMPTNQSDWDNMAGDPEFELEFFIDKDESQSHEACEEACLRNEKCMQFMYTEIWTKKEDVPKVQRKCHHGRAITLGAQRKPFLGSDGLGSLQSWSSGWLTDRIANWVREHQDCTLNESDWPS